MNDQGSFAELVRETSLIDKEQAQLALLSEVTPQKRTIRAPHKRANELDGQTWTKYSISIWSDIKKTPEEAALGHPAMFPLELPRRLLRCFTAQEKTIVLDPFVGLGSTILAAEELGKTGIGLDIYPSFIKKAQERLAQLRLPTTENQPASNPRSRFHCVDARYLRRVVPIDSVDIVITSPPYWDILMQERSADRKSTRHYGELEADLGRINSYQKFLESIRDAFEPVHTVLKAGKYCIVVVMDIRKKATLYPFHSELPGIGRKSANVIIREAGGTPQGIFLDLHVLRVVSRLGITKEEKPEKIERTLMKMIPQKHWHATGISLSYLGREICRPTEPICKECLLRKICKYNT